MGKENRMNLPVESVEAYIEEGLNPNHSDHKAVSSFANHAMLGKIRDIPTDDCNLP